MRKIRIRPLRVGHRRRGFTLLEIMLALGLMIFLLAAISQGLTMYSRLSTAGREEVEQSQIGRAVLQQISVDVRSISFTPVESEAAPDDDSVFSVGGGEEEEEPETEDEPIDDDLEPLVPPTETGIIGDSQSLILFCNKPDRRMQYVDRVSAISAKDRTSDMATVKYFLARPGEDGLSGAFAREYLGPGVIKDIVGLARVEGDRQTVNAAATDGNIDVEMEATKLLAAEVIALEFSYYGDGEWQDSWDTMESNSLPQAIKVKISVQLQPEEQVSRFQMTDASDVENDRPVREFVRIIPVVLTPPIDPAELEP